MDLYAKGQLSFLILNCLLERDFYGLDFISEINNRSNGRINLKKPSVYSNLTRMEKQGYVSSYLQNSDLGPNRKYYSVTEKGRRFYNDLKDYFERNNIDVFRDFNDGNNVNDESKKLTNDDKNISSYNEAKEYFDVYAVTAVSKNNIFGYGYETAFSCELEGGGSTLITGDNHAVISYTHCVEDIDYDNALAVVILNSDEYAGTTYFGFADTYNQRMLDFAIAYCPVIESLESEYFRQVLVHEAIGHGFAKLEDEYAYEEQGRIPDSEIEKTRNLQSLYGWAQNVDFTDDAERVLWHEFLEDDRYAGEGLGVFEGACTYVKGAYRATENSMMNDNTIGFNAPSRKAIYDRIMKLGVGEDPAYEAFVEFDLQTDKRPSVYSRTESGKRKRFARPRFVGVGTFCLK